MKTLSIIIPVYNEEKSVTTLLDKVKDVKLIENLRKEIIIVDDASKDNSVELLNTYKRNNESLNIILVTQEKNKGKGAAIRSGINKSNGHFIIIQDADLEYEPQEYNSLLYPILNGKADVVYGSRFIGGRPHRVLFFWHSYGNYFLTFLSNMFTNIKLTDMETCYKMFNASILKDIDLKENRFGFEPEVTAKISRIPDIKIYEVGISYYGRSYEEGKKIGWKDGVRAIFCIFKYGLLRMK